MFWSAFCAICKSRGVASSSSGGIGGWLWGGPVAGELAQDGQVSAEMLRAGELAGTGGSSELAWPLDDDALEDLRGTWGLPTCAVRRLWGAWPAREAKLAGRGDAVFSAVFGAGSARDADLKERAPGGALGDGFPVGVSGIARAAVGT